jgi:type VI secretion system protein ImpK
VKIEHWHLVLEARRRIAALADDTLPPGTQAPASAVTGGARATPVRADAKALHELHTALIAELESVRVALAKDLGNPQAQAALRPLVYLVDENILSRLSDDDELSWPLLQKRLYNVETGGDHFFVFAEEQLAQGDAPSLVFEMLVFALSAGFRGRYHDNPGKLREYEGRLSARIQLPPRATPQPVQPEVPSRIYQFPVRYYVATFAAVVLVQLLLLFFSNHGLLGTPALGHPWR